jgi:hypothetical protein
MDLVLLARFWFAACVRESALLVPSVPVPDFVLSPLLALLLCGGSHGGRLSQFILPPAQAGQRGSDR